MTQTPYNDPTGYDPSLDPSHDADGKYIKPEDRVNVSVGTSDNTYDPANDPRITHTGEVGYAVSEFPTGGLPAGGVPPETYGVPAQPIPGEGQYVDPGMYVENDGSTGPMATPPVDPYNDATFTVPDMVGTGNTAYDDPAYYASAVDYSVAGMGTGVYNVDLPTHDHSEIHQHLHDLNQKVDELNAKVDHLLEHMHQPMTGTLQIDCPPKA